MNTENLSNQFLSGETLAPISDLQDYGTTIVAELDCAEVALDNSENQPFSGISPQVMRDIAQLRERQFDMFRSHVEIEQAYKIQNAGADANDVQRMSFSGIATTMRKKESATAGLLNKLADFDNHLRSLVDKFETPPPTEPPPAGAGNEQPVPQQGFATPPDNLPTS